MSNRFVRVTGFALFLALALTVIVSFAAASTPAAPTSTAATAAAANKININTAQVSELAKLPRIGDSIAKRIIEYRTKNGAFKTPEDLMKVSGIGEKTFAQIRNQITIVAPAAEPK